MAFDRFNDKPARRENRFSDRGPREGRFFEKREFGDRSRFSDRSEGFRSREGGRFENRSEGRDRPRFGDKPRFGDRQRFGARRDGDFEFAKRSGPRAKAFETRRYTDRNAFVQTATVRLDADVFEHFKTPEAVNNALRQVIALAAFVTPAQTKEAEESVQSSVENEEQAQDLESQEEVPAEEAGDFDETLTASSQADE